MKLEVGRQFWILATLGIAIFTILIVGRNAMHIAQINSELSALEADQELYRAKINRDSTLIEHLRFDDYLEEYARENFRMQRHGDRVYVIAD